MADNDTQAQAGSTSTEAAPVAAEPQSTFAQHEELDRLLSDSEWTPETPADEAKGENPAGEQSQETAQATQEEQPAAPAEETTDEDDDKDEAGGTPDKAKRFRFSDPKDRQFAALRKEGVPPEEAARIAYGIAKPQSETPAGETRQQSQQPDDLTKWQERLAVIDQSLTDNGAEEGLMNDEILALMKERSDLVADIKTEQRFRKHEQQTKLAQAAGQLNAVLRESKAAAEERFPSILDESSEVCREADRLAALYHGTPVMKEASAPMQIAEQAVLNVARAKAKANGTSIAAEFAKLEAGKPVQQQQATTQQQAKTVTAKKLTPASGASATRGPDEPANEDQQLQAAQTATDPRKQHEDLERLLYGT